MQDNQLLSGPIRPALVRFAVPVILSMLATQLYTVVDTMIVGLRLDANALAAVSNASTIIMVFLFVSGGMELGANLVVAARGPVSTKEELSRIAWNLIALDVMIAAVMLLLGIFAFRPLLLLINTPEEIVSAAVLYGMVYLVGLPFQMVYDLCKQILVAVGDSRSPMILVVITSVMNILLDLLLVGPFGVAGAAAASSAAQLAGCVLVMVLMKKRVLTSGFRFSLLKRENMAEIIRLAFPNTVQQLSGPVVTMIKQGLLGTLGVMAIAGYSCASKLSSFMMMPVYGFVQSLVTFIAQNEAVGRKDRVRQGDREGMKLLAVYVAVVVALCLLLRGNLLRLFTTDREAIAYGAIILTFEPLSWFPQAFRHLKEATLRGRQQMGRYLLSNMGTIAVNIICAMILVPLVGYAGFWISTWISTLTGAVLAVLMVRSGSKAPAASEEPTA